MVSVKQMQNEWTFILSNFVWCPGLFYKKSRQNNSPVIIRWKPIQLNKNPLIISAYFYSCLIFRYQPIFSIDISYKPLSRCERQYFPTFPQKINYSFEDTRKEQFSSCQKLEKEFQTE